MTYPYDSIKPTQSVTAVAGDAIYAQINLDPTSPGISACVIRLIRVEKEIEKPYKLRAVVESENTSESDSEPMIMYPLYLNHITWPMKHPVALPITAKPFPELTVIVYNMHQSGDLTIVCDKISPPVVQFSIYAPDGSTMGLTRVGIN